MTKYLVRYSGSLGLRPLEFTTEERNSTLALAWVCGDLAHYFPIYYVADVFSEDGKFIKRISAQVMTKINP